MEKHCNNINAKKSDCIFNLNNNELPCPNKESTNKKLIYSQIKNHSNPPKKINSSKKQKSIKLFPNENKSINKTSQVIFIKENISNSKNVHVKLKKENKENYPIEMNLLNREGKEQKNIKTNVEERAKKEKVPETKIINKPINKKKKKKLKIINLTDLTEVDFNEFDYHKALKYDQRTLIQLYFSYLRLKHSLLSIFYDNYNITVIKIILFVHSFGCHLCINGLFFREDTMHRIYIDNGHFNFIYRLPFTLYSVVISGIISLLLRKLVLTQRSIINYTKGIEKLQNKYETINKAVSIIKCYKIQYIFFVISIIITIVIYWFYIGCFCTVYHNTQFYLLKDSLIGFGLSMLYPIGLFLIAVLLRLIAIKKKYPFLYKISKLIA